MKTYQHPEVEFVIFEKDVMANGDIYPSYCDCVGAHAAVCDHCRVDNCWDDIPPA